MPQFTKLRTQIPDDFRDLFGRKRRFGSGIEVTAFTKTLNDAMPEEIEDRLLIKSL
jgi:hypothetical protein